MKHVRFNVFCFLFAGFAASAVAAPPASCGALNAGLQILSGVPTTGSNYAGALKMAVWYPTNSAASTYTYTGVGGNVTGQVALGAPAASCAQFPLVIFSHGWSGCGTQVVYLTEQLARQGYIVAAPDHNDHGCSVDGTSIGLLQVNFEFPFTKFGDASTWTDQTALYRNQDIEAVLTYMLNTWAGRSAINPNEIVMSGHSFGGYTAFAKIGGWSSWFNAKFKAGIVFSPYIQAFQSQNPETVSSATVPQLFMTGGPQDKGIEPWIIGPQPCSGLGSQNCGDPGAFEQSGGVKYYGELPGSTGDEATHYAFTNLICTDFGFTSVQTCLAGVPNAATIVNYTQDFLDHFTGGQTPQYLWSTGPQFATYWQTSGVPVGSYKAGMGGAPLELESIFGERLTTDAASAAGGAPTMPQTIGRTTVSVLDSQGVSRPGNLYYVSPQQVNLVIPAGTATGQAVISISAGGALVSSGPVTIKAEAPSLLTLPGNVLAGWAISSAGYVPIWSASSPLPLNVSDGQTYLSAMGTGLRGGASSLTATIGNVQFDGVHAPLPVLAASPSYQGIDQVNIGPLPASLKGAGTVNMVIRVAGQVTNTVQIAFQ
jgi:uncharacterized protein (TIGR03437 family)